MSQETLLEKVIRTTEVGSAGGGILTTEQSNRFIDYMFDETTLVRAVRTIRMSAPELEVDKIAVGERLARLATEAVDDGVNAGAAFTKVSLSTKKLRLDWELSSESLEDNLEGPALEEHIARLMANAFGNDMEDLAINGDTALTTDPLLKSFNGWRKLGIAGANIVDAAGDSFSRAVVNKLLKSMPRKYMQRRASLRLLAGTQLIQDYLYGLTQTNSALVNLEVAATRVAEQGPVRTEGAAGFDNLSIFGVRAHEVPLFDQAIVGTHSGATGDHGDVWLLDPKNLIMGIKRDVIIHREFQPKKDAIEFTSFVRIGVAIENTEALSIATNVSVQE